MYTNDHGDFPNNTDNDCAGWDSDGNQTFLQPLIDENYLSP